MGQYQRPEEVFAFCGGSVASAPRRCARPGKFDDDFFLYYEDTDLSWRLRSLGWRIRYSRRRWPATSTRPPRSSGRRCSCSHRPQPAAHADQERRAGLAAREVLRYPLTTASLALREVAAPATPAAGPRSARPCCACGSSAPTCPAPGQCWSAAAARPGVGRLQTPGTLAGAAVRVGLDATPLLGPRTGVGRYVAGLAGALATLAGPEPEELALVPFSWRGTRELPGVWPRTACPVRAPPGPGPAAPGRLGPPAWPPVEWLSGPVEVFHGTTSSSRRPGGQPPWSPSMT